MDVQKIFLLVAVFLACVQAAVIDRSDPDWVNSLQSDKLDEDEIEALSVDDSHADQDLEQELQDIEAKRGKPKKGPKDKGAEQRIEEVNEKNVESIPVKITEGDIAVSLTGDQDDDDKLEKKATVRNLRYIWQNRTVFYTLDNSLARETKAKILDVMKKFNSKSCLHFTDVTDNKSSVKTYLEFKKLSGCWSYIGRRISGAQEVSIGKGCEYESIISHELMHALGFFHEQSRPDRDTFVEIFWENIKEGKEKNFRKKPRENAQFLGTAYDYSSIMHYDKGAFAKGRSLVTIKPIGNDTAKIGLVSDLSAVDWQEVNSLYQCHLPNGGFSEWSNWSPCLTGRYGMYRRRQKYCFQEDRSNCLKADSHGLVFDDQTVSCQDSFCKVDAHWSKWSPWSDCTAPRGTTQTVSRTRTCNNPQQRCGGKTCPDSPTATQSCYTGNIIGPDDCEFEEKAKPTCHWENVIASAKFTWQRGTGSTPSSGTGPQGDASANYNGTGHYMFVEASSPAAKGMKANLCSKEFKGLTKTTLSFKYHALVSKGSFLRVVLSNTLGKTVLWQLTDQSIDKWSDASVSIDSKTNYKVCFESERGGSFKADYAIDDLKFTSGQVDVCASSPCQNGGSCTKSAANTFTCKCLPGYSGTTCTINNDECASSPCQNGGACVDGVNSFTCNCLPGYSGATCTINNDECASSPCQNGGACVDGVNSFACNCLPGYSGATCTISINDCASSPCQNSGTCVDGLNSFTCICPPGYTGPTCNTNVSECASSPCQNGGACVDGVDSFTCNCLPGYSGATCNIKIDVCASSPCQNGGNCILSSANTFTCNCLPGYSGPTCSININDCASSPCQNSGTCVDGLNSFTCICPPGYTGPTCNTNINDCASSPCQNSGTCVDGLNSFTCICPPGYTGPTCNTNVSECASSPCQNGGACVDGVDSFTCNCLPGYSGATCNINIDDCASSPCQNSGTCVDGLNSFTCNCKPGYTGPTCDINIDDCVSSPCQNGGACVDGVNSFTCNCKPGYTGPTCTINIDECASYPCKNGGICNDGLNSFTCTCTSGFTGLLCEKKIDVCTSSPCQNGGNCILSGSNTFTCNCLPGYSGPTCSININECASSPCQNGGACVDGVNSFTCNCKLGFTGLTCSTKIDVCASSPCQNGGNCLLSGANTFTCNCLPGYSGPTCSININDCASSPCQNSGTCVDGLNSFTCICPPGYTGPTCNTNINECASSPCQNSGTCVDGLNSFTCICPPGYTGPTCNTNVSECASSPCQNGGACVDGVDSFTCNCLPGYSGATCNIKIDACASSPCQNGGNCILSSANTFTCNCLPGYSGPTCSININDCASSPCQNSGTCVDGLNSFTCICPPGYTGPTCNTNINDCASSPCQNSGTCVDGLNSFTCICPPGYTGPTCNTNISECASSPCQNGGACVDGVDSFTCSCLPGYSGATCNIKIDVCASSPCQNGGNCILSGSNTFTCNCLPGYSGPTCSININDCASSPCQNSGTCVDGLNSFTCICPPGYTGPTCNTNIDECASSPCQNGGTCVDGVNSFTCSCKPGFTGLTCNIQIDVCASTPCLNGGSCIDGVTSFTCLCAVGYTGPTCNINIDECTSGPCQNGGSCVDGLNSFTCNCPSGFTGVLCESTISTTPQPPTTGPPTTKPPTSRPPGNFKDYISCNFECGLCWWKQKSVAGLLDWARVRGSSKSYYLSPSHDHTTAKKGYYLFTEASNPRKPNHNAIMQTPSMESDGKARCIDFYYHMFGIGKDTLQLRVEYDGVKKTIFSKSGDFVNTWHRGQATLDVPSGKKFKVYLESVLSAEYSGDTSIDDVRVWSGACTKLSTPSVLACPLEKNVKYCDWIQLTSDNGNWRMKRARRRGKWWSSHQKGGENGKDDDVSENAGDASANAASDDDVDDDDVDDVDVSDMNDVDNSSPEEALDGENSLEANDPHRRRSGGKGPRQAITGRRDSYAYFKGRKSANVETAVLQSKAISTSGDSCMRFFVHMSGRKIGKLSITMVDMETNSRTELQKITGNQKGRWFESEANIPAGSNFKIEIAATQGRKARIAIDEIQVTPGKCSFYKNLFSCDFSSGACGLKQTEEDDCDWKVVKSQRGGSLQWKASECQGHSNHWDDHASYALVTRKVHVPPRGGCLTVHFYLGKGDKCEIEVRLGDAFDSWYKAKRSFHSDNLIYYKKVRSMNGKLHTARITVPPQRGGCPSKIIEFGTELGDSHYGGQCEQVNIDSIFWRDGICGNQ